MVPVGPKGNSTRVKKILFYPISVPRVRAHTRSSWTSRLTLDLLTRRTGHRVNHPDHPELLTVRIVQKSTTITTTRPPVWHSWWPYFGRRTGSLSRLRREVGEDSQCNLRNDESTEMDYDPFKDLRWYFVGSIITVSTLSTSGKLLGR